MSRVRLCYPVRGLGHLPTLQPQSSLSSSKVPAAPRIQTMPLEATMIVLDNSEYMRNGDYQPTRFGALADAVTTVFQTKIDANPENTVGIMTMANNGCVQTP